MLKNSEILKLALEKLGPRLCPYPKTAFVCIAVLKVRRGAPCNHTQVADLLSWINEKINYSNTLEDYIEKTNLPLWEKLEEEQGWLDYRISWVNEMITYWQCVEAEQ